MSLGPGVRARAWCSPGYKPRHAAGAHDDVEVAWVNQGAIHYAVGIRSVAVGAGQALIVPPGVEHRTGFSADTRANSLWLSKGLFDGVGRTLGALGASEPSLVADPTAVAALGQQLLRAAETKDSTRPLMVDALCEALALRLLRPGGDPVAMHPIADARIRRTIALIESACAEPWTIATLAREAGLSRYHFSRLFRQCTGASPYRFLLRTRLCVAARQLRSGTHSVTEAAFGVGFDDLSRFARLFRREIGCVPSALLPAGASARFA